MITHDFQTELCFDNGAKILVPEGKIEKTLHGAYSYREGDVDVHMGLTEKIEKTS
ncbi:hypothetical protein [Ammoniphilus sp. CFH 90114]|uniref:hypothetical protein n=1 Tax=Ammoniphilus sp. CFH 90114 TaxID=2493665 RepID=UPI0013E96FAE|nr:hypothetical protein [Ammoniphilus sp. CFH 90114]